MELDVLAAVQRSFIDLKEKKLIVSGFTVYKCTKCHKQTEILRDKDECKSVEKFISAKVCLSSEKKIPKEVFDNLTKKDKSTLEKLGSKIKGKKDDAGT